MKRNTGKSAWTLLAAGCVLLLLPGLAAGFDQDPWQKKGLMREKVGQACGESLKALCGGVRGPGEIRCLFDHYDETSEACRAVLDEIEQRREAKRAQRRERVAAACGESLDAFCGGRDGPECVGCLMDHYEQATAECRALLDEIRAKRRAGRGPMAF